jgi:hypothetical protein
MVLNPFSGTDGLRELEVMVGIDLFAYVDQTLEVLGVIRLGPALERGVDVVLIRLGLPRRPPSLRAPHSTVVCRHSPTWR